jgi:hypothetical protein
VSEKESTDIKDLRSRITILEEELDYLRGQLLGLAAVATALPPLAQFDEQTAQSQMHRLADRESLDALEPQYRQPAEKMIEVIVNARTLRTRLHALHPIASPIVEQLDAERHNPRMDSMRTVTRRGAQIFHAMLVIAILLLVGGVFFFGQAFFDAVLETLAEAIRR